ncbi:MAG: polysaccharide deacetylase family protein, partial [Ilumatobacteraceae bacterium]
MSSEQPRQPLFGRRQLLVGGATFLAGMAGVAVWAETRRAGDGTTSSTTGPSTTGPAAAVTTAPPTTTPAATTPDTTLLDTTTSAPATSIVASSTSLAVVGPATYVNHGPSDVDNVALTFHLGGNPTLVAELLDLLKTSGVHSTLFAIGDWLTANPQLGHRAVDDGHELGNHTKSHLSMLKLSRSAV